MTGHAEILREQQNYYSARAAEYDEWWLRTGRYDRGEEENAVWFREQDEVRSAFAALPWHGDVLELAGGTGIWTSWLAPRVGSLTVLDGSAEMIAINAARLDAEGLRGRVSYQQTNLFDWQPDREYDGLFVGYFLSHVPTALSDAFLAKIARAIKPGGLFAMIDGRRDKRSSSPDQPPPTEGEEIKIRRLNDGRTFQIVKRYDEPEPFTSALARAGINARVSITATHFIYATGVRGEDQVAD